jgi:hypothetical protein
VTSPHAGSAHVSSAHGTSAADACSVGFDRLEVSAYGTAARATFFVAVEQPGPWGRDAATESHLPAAVGRSLSASCAERGGRLSLIRRPGLHADAHHGGGHTAYLAWAGTDPWLLRLTVEDPATLLSLDLDALAAGDRAAVAISAPGAVPSEPVLLVCTNGRRDVCCAVRGRPVALEAAAASPGRVWEASHTGGHRFAPTGVVLPHGATFARLDNDLCGELLEAAGGDEVPARALGPQHDRGRSALEPAAQAAESHVRHQESITDLRALRCAAAPHWLAVQAPAPGTGAHGRTYAVDHVDGRRWLVHCTPEHRAELPESCGKAPVPIVGWAARTLG